MAEKKVELSAWERVIPIPVEVEMGEGEFAYDMETVIYYEGDLENCAGYLSSKLALAAGGPLKAEAGHGAGKGIQLWTESTRTDLGEEGYELEVWPEGAAVTARTPAGVFWGIQTLRQVMEGASIPAGRVVDGPRLEYRGMMLDVSRHFFGLEDVKSLIDQLAYYKLNRLHLHLTDDQGWRLEIKSWPNLAVHGGSTAVGGGAGGYYTQEEYAELVAYADSQYIMVIPEIDIPGHTNAALASYPELNENGEAPELYTGVEVGFSSLAIGKERTYEFLDDVIGEVAALTPGPYIHIGGDECHSTKKEDYLVFMDRIEKIVQGHGKRMIAWEEAANTPLDSSSVVQMWLMGLANEAQKLGVEVILSPAKMIYLDMKYDSDTPIGLDWAAMISVRESYEWDPAAAAGGLREEKVLGIEAPLWTETVETRADIEYLVFPRLLSAAEIGWSPQARRDWEAYKLRLAAHGVRWKEAGMNFYPAPEVPW